MISPVPNQAARIIKPFTGLFYGWRMVAAASAVRVLGAGLHSYGFTVFFLPRSQELNPSARQRLSRSLFPAPKAPSKGPSSVTCSIAMARGR
jgi:hypothetical protein